MSNIILIALCSILFFTLAKIRLNLAVALMIFSLPSYLIRFNLFGIPFTMLEVMIFISFGFWLWDDHKRIVDNVKKRLKYRKKQKKIGKLIRYPFDTEIIMLLVVSFISIIVASFTDASLGIWKAYFFEPILVYILILNIFRKSDKKEIDCYLISPLVYSALTISIFAIYQKFTGAFILNDFWAAEATRRVTSFFEYPNAVGLFLAPLILLMAGWVADKARKLKIRKDDIFKKEFLKIYVVVLTALLSYLAIYFAKSEGAFLAVTVALIIFAMFLNKKIKYLTIIFAAIVCLFIATCPIARDVAIEKLTLRDLSGEIRKQQWRETWQLLTSSRANFILGTGLSGYQKAVSPYHQEGIFFNKERDPDFRRKIVIFDDKYRSEHWQPVETYMYPHNIFLNFWVELGFFGMILFIYFIGRFFYLSYRLYKKENDKYLILGVSGAMLVIVIHGLVDVPYFKNDLAVIFWLLLAMFGLVQTRRQLLKHIK